MNLKDYSMFILCSHIDITFLIENSTYEFNNRIWRWEFLGNHNKSSGFELYWIDIIKYKNNKIHGQIDSVQIWQLNKNKMSVFTSSYSVINLVRNFLREERGINTEIHRFSDANILGMINSINSKLLSIYLIKEDEIIKLNANELNNQIDLKDIFAVDILQKIDDTHLTLFISSFGLIKFPYGSNIETVLKVCESLEIIS